jgi:hypothetical protein
VGVYPERPRHREIGNKKHKIGAGDFMGFVADSEPHCHAQSAPSRTSFIWWAVIAGRPMFAITRASVKRRYRMNGDNAYVDLAALTPVSGCSS